MMSEPVSAAASSPLPWWRGRMAALDFETTGPDPMEARPVQAAFVLLGGGQPTEKHVWLIDPGVDIPAEASAIHNIHTADVKAHGIDPGRFLEQFDPLLRRAIDQGLPVCTMNGSYDFTVLVREWERLGVVDVTLPFIIDVRVLDKQADEILGYHRKGGRKLADLCHYYRAQLDGAHDACHDAIAAARVAYRIAQKFDQFGNNSLENLQALQAAWYRDQQKSLDEYFRKKGDGRRVTNFSWPIQREASDAL